MLRLPKFIPINLIKKMTISTQYSLIDTREDIGRRHHMYSNIHKLKVGHIREQEMVDLIILPSQK